MPRRQNWSHALRNLGPRPVGTVEWRAEILVELGTVVGHPGPDAIERFQWQAARIGRGLQHQRRHRAQQKSLGDTLGAVAADVASDFATAGGVAHVDGILQIEFFGECGEIIRVRVHFIAAPRLARAAMAATVMSDRPVTVVRDE
jgi:hypothetical protein